MPEEKQLAVWRLPPSFAVVWVSLSALLYAGAPSSVALAQQAESIRVLPAQTQWDSPPEQARSKEGVAVLPSGAQLWYWDTGGDGEPVIFLHAGSGNAGSWLYQQPVLVNAGYRVIAYSRRGYSKSSAAADDSLSSASVDLNELADFLHLERFHLVAVAAGGAVALDYAISHEARLLSLTFSNSLGNIRDKQFSETINKLLPKGFNQMPVEFRELGASYRASNPSGVQQWLEMHNQNPSTIQSQKSVNRVTWAELERLRVPTLLMTGAADLYMPVSSVREFLKHLPNAEAAVFLESGHAPNWEQPQVFNAELLRFFRRHSKMAR